MLCHGSSMFDRQDRQWSAFRPVYQMAFLKGTINKWMNEGVCVCCRNILYNCLINENKIAFNFLIILALDRQLCKIEYKIYEMIVT